MKQRRVRQPTDQTSSMKITKIAYSHGATVQFEKYNTINVHITMEAEVQEDQDPSTILASLKKRVNQEIEECAIERSETFQDIKANMR